MLKFIGAVALIGGVGLGAAVYTGVLDFNATAKVTPKGEAQVQELREQAADAIRGVGNGAADAARGNPSK
jgi:hypothetical protein